MPCYITLVPNLEAFLLPHSCHSEQIFLMPGLWKRGNYRFIYQNPARCAKNTASPGTDSSHVFLASSPDFEEELSLWCRKPWLCCRSQWGGFRINTHMPPRFGVMVSVVWGNEGRRGFWLCHITRKNMDRWWGSYEILYWSFEGYFGFNYLFCYWAIVCIGLYKRSWSWKRCCRKM